MSARDLFKCSKNFPHPDSDQAVELLLVRSPFGDEWNVKPRCAEHPAADDIPILRRLDPSTRIAIVPLDGAHE